MYAYASCDRAATYFDLTRFRDRFTGQITHPDRRAFLFVLTVADIPRTIAFYRDVLGMDAVTFGEGRDALVFGRNKINLHRAGASSARTHCTRPRARPTCA
nr:VOC family protein [Herbidospora galbida]